MEVLHIKKYENRRLYSRDEKRYVTLAEIGEWVVAGKKIQVVDVLTELDITPEILTQILIERGRAHHLPVEMLETLIRFNEGAIQKFWLPMFDQTFKMMEKFNPMSLMQNLVKDSSPSASPRTSKPRNK